MESAAGLATMGWFSKGLVYVAGSCFEKSNGGAISSFRKQRYQCGVFYKGKMIIQNGIPPDSTYSSFFAIKLKDGKV